MLCLWNLISLFTGACYPTLSSAIGIQLAHFLAPDFCFAWFKGLSCWLQYFSFCLFQIIVCSWDSIVPAVIIGLRSLALILLFATVVTPVLRPAQPSVEWMLLVKWQGLEGDHLHKCNAAFNTVWIYLSTAINLSVVVPADSFILMSGILWNCCFKMYVRMTLDFVWYLSWTVIDTCSRYLEC
jgi:hypothetical protein